ncbi:MAG: nitric-oxide reductase large subunit, partial [bacterium]|nr:nitric-oxide reductase large subunit [bacterium]
YAMIVLAMISYALPEMTGRAMHKHWMAEWGFWLSNIGMIAMTGAFGVMGVAQVYMERKSGMDFMVVQESLEVHALGLVCAGALLTLGIVFFIKNFISYGLPVMDESKGAVGGNPAPAAPDKSL